MQEREVLADLPRAPIVFFEVVGPQEFFNHGIVALTLAAGVTRVVGKQGETEGQAVAVAHLRCTVAAALHLRQALDRILLLAAPTEGGKN